MQSPSDSVQPTQSIAIESVAIEDEIIITDTKAAQPTVVNLAQNPLPDDDIEEINTISPKEFRNIQKKQARTEAEQATQRETTKVAK